jgi:hypothetical protein
LLQYPLQGKAFSDNFLEIVLGADFILEIEPLFREPVRSVHDPTESQRVLHSERYLIGDMLQQFRVPSGEILLL